jgi:uncharacterized iron-regulated membrane protein
MIMRWMPSLSTVVRKSLAGHAWLGLVIGGLMYLICLSGTLAVFFQEFERWEQPEVRESLDYDPVAVQRAVAAVLGRLPKSPDHLYVSLPTPEMPRLSVATDQESQAWFVNADGSLGQPVAHDWTHLLLNLHIYLHLPSTFGLLVVGASGALLVGLVVSGFLAHPRIVKDAFRFRVGGSRQLEQADLHNRLSVWGAPFHVIIGLTGAYFGLASVTFVLLGAAFHDGKTEEATAMIYGAEPKVEGAGGVPDVAAALREARTVLPAGTSPSFVIVHDAATRAQYIDLLAVHPGRLIWGEYYRFAASGGTYLGRTDYSDGPVGRQAIYSSYRIHFGNFGGLPVKVLYGLLGLSLTVISATGINIWLARRRTRDYLNDLWTGAVWGAPLALALTALTEVMGDVRSKPLFWVTLVAAMSWALRLQDPARAKRQLCAGTAALLGTLLAGYFLTFDLRALTPAAWWITGGVLGAAGVMSAIALRAAPTPPTLAVARHAEMALERQP